MTDREVVTFHFGNLGTLVGEEFWASFGKDPCKTFFSETESTYTPRALSFSFPDDDEDPERIVKRIPTHECHNFPKGLFEENHLKVIDKVTKMAEECDNLQGFQFITGSEGMATNYLKKVRDEFPNVDVVTHWFNADPYSDKDAGSAKIDDVLMADTLIEFSTQCLVYQCNHLDSHSDIGLARMLGDAISGYCAFLHYPASYGPRDLGNRKWEVTSSKLRAISKLLIPFPKMNMLAPGFWRVYEPNNAINTADYVLNNLMANVGQKQPIATALFFGGGVDLKHLDSTVEAVVVPKAPPSVTAVINSTGMGIALAEIEEFSMDTFVKHSKSYIKAKMESWKMEAASGNLKALAKRYNEYAEDWNPRENKAFTHWFIKDGIDEEEIERLEWRPYPPCSQKRRLTHEEVPFVLDAAIRGNTPPPESEQEKSEEIKKEKSVTLELPAKDGGFLCC